MFKKRKELITVQKFRPAFTTMDGNVHLGLSYNYAIKDRLACAVPEYIMIDIKRDGYIEDHRNVMYLLANVLSIDWHLEDEKVIENKFSDYRIFLKEEEVSQYGSD